METYLSCFPSVWFGIWGGDILASRNIIVWNQLQVQQNIVEKQSGHIAIRIDEFPLDLSKVMVEIDAQHLVDSLEQSGVNIDVVRDNEPLKCVQQSPEWAHCLLSLIHI